jgi:rhodanese-related sulfurtransferase
MLTELTEEQRQMMVTVRDEWINFTLHSGKQPSSAELRPYVDWLYRTFNKKPPVIVICSGPMVQQLTINILKSEEFWKSLKHGKIKIGRPVGSAVRSALKQTYFQYEGLGSESWISLYDYFTRISFAPKMT